MFVPESHVPLQFGKKSVHRRSRSDVTQDVSRLLQNRKIPISPRAIGGGIDGFQYSPPSRTGVLPSRPPTPLSRSLSTPDGQLKEPKTSVETDGTEPKDTSNPAIQVSAAEIKVVDEDTEIKVPEEDDSETKEADGDTKGSEGSSE